MSSTAPNTYVALDGLKVGIVEDNAYFRRLIRTMLNGMGIRQVWEGTTVASGWEMVVARARQGVRPVGEGDARTRLFRPIDWKRPVPA